MLIRSVCWPDPVLGSRSLGGTVFTINWSDLRHALKDADNSVCWLDDAQCGIGPPILILVRSDHCERSCFGDKRHDPWAPWALGGYPPWQEILNSVPNKHNKYAPGHEARWKRDLTAQLSNQRGG
jgi:hypothetical protein